MPAIDAGWVAEHKQIRTERSLLHATDTIPPNTILDIDLDFWAPGMPMEHFQKTIQKTRQLIQHPHIKLVTIATSPYFLDQDRALQLLHKLLG